MSRAKSPHPARRKGLVAPEWQKFWTGLVRAALPDGDNGVVDLISNALYVPGTAAAAGVGRLGKALLTVDLTTSDLTTPVSGPFDAFTVVCVFKMDTNSDRRAVFMVGDNNDGILTSHLGSEVWRLLIRDSVGGDVTLDTGAYAQNVNHDHLLCIRWDGVTLSIVLYDLQEGGTPKASNSVAFSTQVTLGTNEVLWGVNQIDGLGGLFYMGALWDRAISDDMVMRLVVDPFGPFRPDLRVIGKAAAVGGLSIPVAMHSYRRRRVAA